MQKQRSKNNDIITSLTEKFQMDIEANKNEIKEIKEEVKDVKRNLENMGNIVGKNIISMEHQLKSEKNQWNVQTIKLRAKLKIE